MRTDNRTLPSQFRHRGCTRGDRSRRRAARSLFRSHGVAGNDALQRDARVAAPERRTPR